MSDSSESRKIMTKPLPQILDEIEDSLKSADAAAKQARDAAVEAQRAGEKAISEATRVANERVVAVEKIAREALAMAQLLRQALCDEAANIGKKLADTDSSE